MSDERWLEGSEDPARLAVRQALDESERFTHSELRQRRVWARVSEPGRTTRATRHAFLRGALAATALAAVLAGGARFHVFAPLGSTPFKGQASAVAPTATHPLAPALADASGAAGSILETRAGER